MNPNETRELMDTISLVRKEYGVTILLIEHDMKLVQGICEYLYVLNFGKLLTEGEPKDVLNNPEVITAYLGDCNRRHEPRFVPDSILKRRISWQCSPSKS